MGSGKGQNYQRSESDAGTSAKSGHQRHKEETMGKLDIMFPSHIAFDTDAVAIRVRISVV